MIDIEQHLRRYGDVLDGQGPTHVSEPTGARPIPKGPMRRSLLVAGAACVVVLVVGIVAAVLIRPDSERARVSSPPTAEPTARPNFEPYVQSGDEYNRCLRATYPGGTAETCITMPGASIWRVDGTDYVVFSGDLTLTDGALVPMNAGRFTIAPAADVAQRVQGLGNCYSPALTDSVAQQVRNPQPTYLLGGCSPSVAHLSLESTDLAASAPSLWFRRDESGARWDYLATVDFSNPDRQARCSGLPDETLSGGPMTIRGQCEMLG
jgi:hypothetical protein